MTSITSSLKIIHITASYKPAYIYGGPIQSVAKLAEAITSLNDRQLAPNRLEKKANVLELNKEILRCNKDDKYSAEDDKTINVKVITTTANGTKELDVKTGVPVLVEGVHITYFKRWTKDHSHFSPGLLWELRKTLRQAQDDKIIVHIHAWWNLVSVLSCLIAKWYKIPVVLSPRGMLTSYTLGNRNSLSKKLIHTLLGKNLLKYCHIHATSKQEKADILKIVKPKSIRVIPNLVSLPSQVTNTKYQKVENPHQVADSKYQDEACFKLIFLSRIEEKKGLELLFNALATVDIPWTLTIAGSGEEQYLQDLKLLASKLKLSNSIDWVGQVSNKDKYTLIAAHDLLVLTSYNENFANVVVESLSVGTPIFISEHVGLADYVKDNELGWVTSLETNEIKNNIISAYQNPKKRQQIGNNAPLIIRRDFNDDVLARQYLESYKTI